ncbi:MAG: hypothetical protein WCF12_08295 [Propionicimonas sp.]
MNPTTSNAPQSSSPDTPSPASAVETAVRDLLDFRGEHATGDA